MSWQEGELQRLAGRREGEEDGQPDERGDDRGVEGLGEEDVGDALDVAQDPAALRDDMRHDRELVVEKHELGDRAGRRGPRAHRDAEVRLLEREDVVDAVTGHGDRAVAQVQGSHHGLLLARGHATEDAVLVHRIGQLLRILGEFTRIDGIIRTGHAGLRGDGSDGRGVVAGDDLDGDVLLEEVADRLGGIGS